jgi:hypothetical protein
MNPEVLSVNSEVTSLNSRVPSVCCQEVFSVSLLFARNLWIVIRRFTVAGEVSGFQRKLLPPSSEKTKE